MLSDMAESKKSDEDKQREELLLQVNFILLTSVIRFIRRSDALPCLLVEHPNPPPFHLKKKRGDGVFLLFLAFAGAITRVGPILTPFLTR